MARVNVGVNPIYLADQHLIAESVEITMIVGSLRKNDYIIKSEVPEKYNLGKGHMNFFKTKLIYLARRLEAVNKEMVRRGFSPGTTIECLQQAPVEFQNDWNPTLEDSMIVRNRIVDKMLKKEVGFWRYKSNPILNIQEFKDSILHSEGFIV